MSECRSPELQDLLPDYAAETLDSVSTTRVRDHLARCVHCADDLGVLQAVRRARPRVSVPDIARIAAALPPSPTRVEAATPGPKLIRDAVAPQGLQRRSSLPPSVQRTRTRATGFGLSAWRLAAMLGVVLAGGASVLVARRGIIDGSGASVFGSPAPSSTMTAVAPRGAETLAVATPASAAQTVSVSYGDLGDYSAAELESMLERLDEWDGATNTEPLPGLPIVPNAGGGTP